MRILAIDASKRHGVVSRSVEIAARAAECSGAKVDRVRLSELEIRSCTNCRICLASGVCKIEDDLPELAKRITEADGVIFGTSSYLTRADETTRAVLDRITGYFADLGQMKLPGLGSEQIPLTRPAREVRRAIIITACSAPEPLATFFGHTTGPIRELRATLGEGGIRTIGSLAVTSTRRETGIDDEELQRAASLGRILAGKI